jgi:hypothetical protein
MKIHRGKITLNSKSKKKIKNDTFNNNLKKHPDPLTTYPMYQKSKTSISSISEQERLFFYHWTGSRHLEQKYMLLAMTYWMRIKSPLGTFFLVNHKEHYMIICIHLAIKWLAYEEENDKKCNYLEDLKQVAPLRSSDHQNMELEILKSLNWEL